jgi:hypothetical protein
MSELFKLKPCEECNGTGDAHHQGHDYDCPDCLGTGYEEPAKRIMNLELMLNQHKETLKSGDAYNNELAQKFEITLEQRDKLAEAVNAATVLIAAKGRHNTMLAYEGLRSALSPKNVKVSAPARKEGL